ncbi:MAG: lysine biosynthesis enzyme LysX, partial [Desulfurococcales archaeon]|nr:lysine biosynthesis enzyme LysX [Desulfurococcales archaeon]
MPTIALLYDHPRWEEKAILQALKDMGADTRLIHVEYTPLRIGEPCCPLDLALERSVSFSNAVATAFAAESWGVKVLNPGTVIYLAGDKVATLSLLASHGVPVPETTILSGSNNLDRGLPQGPPWVVKPVIGSWGRICLLYTS